MYLIIRLLFTKPSHTSVVISEANLYMWKVMENYNELSIIISKKPMRGEDSRIGMNLIRIQTSYQNWHLHELMPERITIH